MSLDLYNSVAEICAGCLSTDRRLELLTGEAESYFSAIVCSVAVHPAPCSVCWECGAELRRALRLRARVAAAQHVLRLYALSQTSLPHSLSNLSLRKTESVDISHDTDKQSRTDDESRPLFIKMETRDEDDDFDGLYVDGSVAERSVDMIDDTDLKAVLKQDATEFELKKSTRTKIEDEFDASDDEPLTLKKEKKKREGKKRGRRKKIENGDTENIAPKAEKRGRQEKPAGVVHNARVARRLELLNVPPGALEMIVLTWEEVEAERQRALQSPQYTRHEHRCGDCAVGFNHRAKLQQHMVKHSPSSGDLECSACHIRSRDQHALAAHRRRHRVRWRCAWCGSLWSRAAVAADHAARAHSARTPTHVCPTCGHVADTLGKLRSHLKEHAERQRCELCGKSFRDRASLRTHLFIHRGEKEYVCPRCDKRFLFKKALQLHQLTHDQPAHLYCHQCDVTFKNRMSYYQHMKYNLKHIDPAKLKYACTMCDKRFAKAVRLAEHRAAVHLKTRPVSCTQPDCSFACASRPVLRAHVRGVHRGVRARRDHVCHHCGKAYTTKKTLEGHLRSHSGERPFHCTVCNASFGYHAALYNHTRLVHLKHKPARSRAAPAPGAAPWPPPGAHTDADVT